MRWLLLGLLISVFALVLLAVAVARHIQRQGQLFPREAPGPLDERKGEE